MNTFLETGISLVLLFFIFSIITYVIQELIAVNLRYRGKMLWRSIEHLLEGKANLVDRVDFLRDLPTGVSPTSQFYNHPQIACLSKTDKHKPSYIPAANFALAIMDIVATNAPAGSPKGRLFDEVKAGLNAYIQSGGKFGAVLKTLCDTSADLKELQGKIESWYNSYMQRVTGWYESQTVGSVRIIALVLALVFNVNVISLSKTIYKDASIRGKMVTMAEQLQSNPDSVLPYYTNTFEKKVEVRKQYYARFIDTVTDDTRRKSYQDAMDNELDSLAAIYTREQKKRIGLLLRELEATGLPIGWSGQHFTCEYWKKTGPTDSGFFNFLLAILGWLIAAGCFSMGAPFWFDVMGKLVNVRRSGVKPEKNKN